MHGLNFNTMEAEVDGTLYFCEHPGLHIGLQDSQKYKSTKQATKQSQIK